MQSVVLPPGTGKSHALLGCGVRAVERGKKVRYLVAADLIETLYRGLADNTVGKVISQLLRNELLLLDELGFAPLDDTGSPLLFRFVAAAYARRSLGVASHWPFEEWGHFLPVQTTAVSLLDRLLQHAVVVVTSGDAWRMKEARTRGPRRDVEHGLRQPLGAGPGGPAPRTRRAHASGSSPAARGDTEHLGALGARRPAGASGSSPPAASTPAVGEPVRRRSLLGPRS